MTKTILLSIENDVAYCTFNRPQDMNTYNDVMSIELLEAVVEIKNNPNVRFMVLQGADHKFMAGGDVHFFAKNLSQMPAGIDEIIERLNQTIEIMHSMDKITIALIEGPCAGVGISFMLACDFALAANDAKFNTGYSALGLTPDGGMSYLLPRCVGFRKASELLLTSKPFLASEALTLGLINQLCENTNLENNLSELLALLRLRSQHALVGSKRLLNASINNSLKEQLELEKQSFIEQSQSQEFKDCVTHFVSR